jgi:hypothetical protein
MSRFKPLKEFERRFDTMSVEELKRWKAYWTDHAQRLAPKIQKLAMKRVHEIENVIKQRAKHETDTE